MTATDIFLSQLAREMVEDCLSVEQDENSVWIEVDKKVWNAYWTYRADMDKGLDE